MFDLIIRNGHVVDPINHFDGLADVAIEDGHVAAVKSGLEASAKEELDTSGKYVIPGIIDMHTHMRTVLGHPHAQRMIALAGVCSTLDMAGPLDDILDSIPTSGAGVNIAVVEAAREGFTIKTGRPDQEERRSLRRCKVFCVQRGVHVGGGANHGCPSCIGVKKSMTRDRGEPSVGATWRVPSYLALFHCVSKVLTKQ